MRFLLLSGLLAVCAAAAPRDEFPHSIRPVLLENCKSCHNPDNPKNKIDFLKATEAAHIETQRGMWRNVAVQLRNRTMPPVASKFAEDDRMRISQWIETRLRETACNAGDFAGPALVRRLNRREYRNTIRDLLGVDLAVNEIFPADGSGGEGFDTNAETLFLPPLLMERYLEANQQVLDMAIITPPLQRSFGVAELQPPHTDTKAIKRPIAPGEELSAQVSVYADADYELRVSLERPREHGIDVAVKVDGVEAGVLHFQRYDSSGPASRSRNVKMARGVHTVSVQAREHPIEIYTFNVNQRQQEPAAEKKAVHYRLFGLEAGEVPPQPRKAAERLLTGFARQAYRRPVAPEEVGTLIRLYDRAAERGDPYEEAVKLALKAVLTSPKFLFRVETLPDQPGIHALNDHELASRLSYFFWSTMPDAELSRLAGEGRLRQPEVLAAQVDRMLDDPRSRVFANTFVGQWLGTKEVGGRVAPTVNEVQHFYTPETAGDLREEPVLLFHHIVSENRSLLDLLDGDYTFLTERLVKFYELEGKVEGVEGNVFRKIHWPDNRRAGVLGLGSVLALTSHFKQTSPVLRGAWVLETLLGTPTPAPPPDVPPLETEAKSQKGLTVRQKLMKHREDPSCSACHNLMDPIGFGLENFDWLGRWRETENGQPLDASGELPTGERFTGPIELREALMARKGEFLRHVTSKVLGYALGRGLQDADQCTVQRIVEAVERDGYRARTLMREVVLSLPFRHAQSVTR
ncbi:MAG: DUF1592 domain-containing protein [Bryobacterales bacterium]|nr:DUF1592 domain-containing protein [Bryobacterales bacterium]